MLKPERQTETETPSERHFGRGNPLFSSVVRLVPCTGLQFIDLEIPTRSLGGTVNKFLKDEDPEQGSLLIRLPDDARVDGFDLHPVTRRPLTPVDTLWLSGYQAIEPFIGTWLPLPYLRFVGRREDGGRFDKGPSNWARLYIEPPAAGVRNVERLKAVLAFDTEVDSRSRVEQQHYLAPNTDDVFFGPVFMLASEPDDLADFLCEGWLDEWVGGAFDSHLARSGDKGERGADGYQLEHLARYVSLLKILGVECGLPQVRFVNTSASHWQQRTFGVDLVIDIDESETAALIVDRRAGPSPARLPQIETLKLRDLAEPTRLHEGPFSTTAEFSQPAFGDVVTSRRSGRADAFFWPSLVRIGQEGKRLSLRGSATPGLTGLSGVARGLGETGARPNVWRFSRSDREGIEPGGMVSGELLEHIAEDGSVIRDEGNGLSPAIRPRFSHSSMLTMFIAECLLHSISQLNAPAALADSGEVRELNRIIVTCPLSASADERKLLQERIESAVDLVWSARGWTTENGLAPERPQVSLGIDPGLSSHLTYLYDEVRNRFASDTRQFMSLTRSRHPHAGGDDRRDDELRIASLEIATGATSLALVGYRLGSEGNIEPRALVGGRTAIAGGSLAEAILRSEILPALARSLTAAGHPDAECLVERVTSATPKCGQPAPAHLASRLLAKALNPAAAAFVEIYQELPQGATTAGAGLLALGRLVERGGGRLEHVAAQLEALAAMEGARSFRLADVPVTIRVRAVAQALATQLDPLLARVAAVIRDQGVDLLLLSGRHAALPDVRKLLLKHLPLGPHRVIDVAERWRQVSKDLSPQAVERFGTRMMPLLGAAFGGGRGSPAMDHFGLLADQLAYAIPEMTADDLPGLDAPTMALRRLAWAGQGELPRLAARSQAGLDASRADAGRPQ